MIKAISFDLWGTLIKSSSEFKRLRTEYIQKWTNKTDNEINDSIQSIKKSFDELVEKHGFHYDSVDLYHILAKKFDISFIDLMNFCKKTFMEHGAIPYCEDTIDVLKALSKKYELHVASNTLLIDGNILKKRLRSIGMVKCFKSMSFSNEVGYSKPNPHMFKHVHDKIGMLKEEIVHIGDNRITDFDGARNYCFNALLINGQTELTIKDVEWKLSE